MSRERDFLRFCQRALGSPQTAPLREQPGALVSALVAAFQETHPLPKARNERSVQGFEDRIYSEPHSVYVIRNTVNGVVYVGRAKGGFLARYPKGEWWKEHHNERLGAAPELV